MRVISGAFGGRRLRAPGGGATRPTSDRVREALFMALEPWTGLRVVDLYAGSGALGIEALSRGAERADFVECERAALEALEANLESLALRDRARVWRLKLPQRLNALREPLRAADVVLADPPYGGEEAAAVLSALGRAKALREGARVVVEHHHRDALPERNGLLSLARQRRYGETVISMYVAGPADAPA